MALIGADFYCYCSFQTGDKLQIVHEHSKSINDIQMYKDMTMFVTASKDTTAKVWSSLIFMKF